MFYFLLTSASFLDTLSLHDALPICLGAALVDVAGDPRAEDVLVAEGHAARVLHRARVELRHEALVVLAERVDRKSTRLNSSHLVISYAVFCLKKKKKKK